MSAAIAMLCGAGVVLMTGAVSAWLAKGMWTFRMTAMQKEIQTLQTYSVVLKKLKDTEDRIASSLLGVTAQLVSAERATQANSEALGKLDSNVFKLIELSTGEIVLAKGGVEQGWGISKGNAMGAQAISSPHSALPQGLGTPT